MTYAASVHCDTNVLAIGCFPSIVLGGEEGSFERFGVFYLTYLGCIFIASSLFNCLYIFPLYLLKCGVLLPSLRSRDVDFAM